MTKGLMRLKSVNCSHASRCAGLTLIELILALAGTAMVAVAISSMLIAVSYGTQSSKDIRELVVKHKIVSARFMAAVRGARQVLAIDTNHLVLWDQDLDASATPNINELRMIYLDNNALTLNSYIADFTGLSAATILSLNVELPIDPNYNYIGTLEAMFGQTYYPASLWATKVLSMSFATNATNLQSASLIGFTATIQAGDLTDTTLGAVSLRN